ncbi:T9SS type A sorting domain-containing protein [Chryseobacterium sp. cx-311]|uniref:T9SS type A sorting domain-containing protein n=1 Tax=Marnyiella aurantia TaxID=2758037 RepID=UPI001AE521E1|nr:T9SS type A sorting domain-containing protein [Marnyiella aurantia]MBP0613789.1 T9SS type A sorting domain-containing protein [Marnyiella aurantia]
MKRIYLLLMLFPIIIFSQGENDNWYFGNKAAVNFSGGSPVSLANSNMYVLEACGSVSDSNGNLLFYTDGRSVWNKNHQLMPNGNNTLNGHFSSQQLAILQHPGNSNQYYIFTTGTTYDTTHFIKYSIVDMTLSNNMGNVLSGQMNIPLTYNNGSHFFSEAVTIVPSSNDSFWIIIPYGQKLYSYKLDSQGLNNGNPVISNLNFPTDLSGAARHFSIKASQKLCESERGFSHFICVSLWHDNYQDAYQNRVYSFDNNTGAITNNFTLQINSIQSYLPEFNKYGSVLFLGYSKIYAIDLVSSTPSNIIFSQIYDLGSEYCSAIQRNKYDDIYISKHSSYYLGKILNPDYYSSNISVDINNLLLGNNMFGQRANHGLPQLVQTAANGNISHCAPENDCLPNITLQNSEVNVDYTHRAVTILAENGYSTSVANGKIIFKAGESSTLLPNTYISEGSDFFAYIEECKRNESGESKKSNDIKNMVLNLDRDTNVKDYKVKISPNPTSNILNIKTDSKINAVSVVDMTGKKINVKLEGDKVNVSALPVGTYLINVETKDGISTEKFIKK